MKLIEKVLLVLYLIGIIMLIAKMRNYTFFIFSSISGLAVLYLFFGFAIYNGVKLNSSFKKESFSTIPMRNIFIAIVAGMFNATLLIGYLFSLNYWPGGNYLFATGFFSTFLLLAIIYFDKQTKYTNLYANISLRMITFGFVIAMQIAIYSIYSLLHSNN